MALTRAERRAFVLEMASVIAGILIALAVNEAVQNWHWAEDVADARASIYEEIRYNNDWLAYRVMIRPCLDARLDRARTVVESLAAGKATRPEPLFEVTIGGRLDDQNWQALRTSSTFEHLPEQERRRLGVYYSQLDDMRSWLGEETRAWRELSLIGFAPKTIERSDVSRMRIAIKGVEVFSELAARNSANQLARAKRFTPAPLLAKAPRYADFLRRISRTCGHFGQRPQDLHAALREAEV